MEIVYCALGSNLDDPFSHVKRAFTQLACLPQTKCLAYSSLYLSPPFGNKEQPDYVNAVVKMETDLTAEGLLSELLALEQKHLRVRTERWGARTLDCDLLFFGQHLINTAQLTVPHPHITERAFVLVPLAEIEPQLAFPGGKTIQYYLSCCDVTTVKKLFF